MDGAACELGCAAFCCFLLLLGGGAGAAEATTATPAVAAAAATGCALAGWDATSWTSLSESVRVMGCPVLASGLLSQLGTGESPSLDTTCRLLAFIRKPGLCTRGTSSSLLDILL